MTKRLVLMLSVVAVGVVVGRATGGVSDVLSGSFYTPIVTGLLAVGLYGSTHSIDVPQLRGDVRTIILAVTLGVVMKAALITGVMFAVFHNTAYLVLGVAVAQIDPLSVVALGRSSRLSPRSRRLLLAWASFDDPVTTLLTIYVAAVALSLHTGNAAVGLDLGGPGAFAVNLLGNAAVAAVAMLAYRWARRLSPWPRFVVACALLVGVFVIAIVQEWVLAVALAGLAIRPVLPGRPAAVARLLDAGIDTAFVLASGLLGLVLALGISPLPGLVLGITAFAVHALVSVPLTRAQTASDRIRLALAQQNGITAIILALLLEPAFGGTVAVVAPAILVINVLYLAGNGLYGSYGTTGRWPSARRLTGRRGEVSIDVARQVEESRGNVRLGQGALSSASYPDRR